MELNIELLNRIKDEVFAEWLNSTDLDHYKHIVSSRPKKFDEITFEVRLYTLWPEVCRRYAEEVNKISFKDLQHDLNKDMTIKVLEQAISQLKKQNETLTNIISEGISKAAIKDETPKEVKPDFEVEIAPPVGDFILGQPDIKGFHGHDGMYFHYSQVCTLLKRYTKDL